MEMLGRIRRMFYRDGLSRSEISRRTGLSRNTIKKWLVAPAAQAPRYRRQSPPGKLTDCVPQLRHTLDVEARRPTRERRNSRSLMGVSKTQDYTGDYTS